MINNKQAGNTNTILIVIVLVILVALGVWWFTMRSAPVDEGTGFDVDVNLPTDGGAGTTVLEGTEGGSAVE